MYQEKICCKAVNADQIEGRTRLQNTLRVCRCGKMTFLPHACRYCGKMPERPFLEGNGGGAIRYITGAAVPLYICMILATVLAFIKLSTIIGVLLLVLTIAMTIQVVLLLGAASNEQVQEAWWFNPSGDNPEKHSIWSEEMLESVRDAYYQDLSELERREAQGEGEAILDDLARLTYVYNNPRLARLQAKVLQSIPVEEAGGLDVELICAHLKASDFPTIRERRKFLQYLKDYSRCGCVFEAWEITRLIKELQDRQIEV